MVSGMEYGQNITKPPIRIAHAELERLSDESLYKSKCPVCPKGVLLIYRKDFGERLLAEDCCIACGQRVIYTDIERLRKMDGLP